MHQEVCRPEGLWNFQPTGTLRHNARLGLKAAGKLAYTIAPAESDAGLAQW